MIFHITKGSLVTEGCRVSLNLSLHYVFKIAFRLSKPSRINFSYKVIYPSITLFVNFGEMSYSVGD